MELRNPNFRESVATVFGDAAFVADLGITPVRIDVGVVESRMTVAPRHLQHHELVHAGVQSTIADHTAGAAATTVIAANEVVLTLNLQVSLLKPAVGEELRCTATVLRAGRRIVVVESEVYACSGERKTLSAKATVTLAVLPNDG